MKKILSLTLLASLLLAALLLASCSYVDLDPCKECVDENKDFICDKCEKPIKTDKCDKCQDNDDNGKCDVCGRAYVHVHTPSTPVTADLVEASCFKDGSYTEIISCSDCNKEISRENKVIPAIGIHNTENGVCTVCGGLESTANLRSR